MTEKKGTLRHKETGREYKDVVLVREDRDYLSIRLVPEAQQRNNFPVGAWDFVPTVQPLPAARGTLTILAPGFYPLICADKKWYQMHWELNGSFALREEDEEYALNRLRQEPGARIFKGAETELKREDYV